MDRQHSAYFRPAGLPGVEALHASFTDHAYRPHSHPTWTIAVMERGAARFTLDDTDQRADRGELFVLEPEAVHTGMPAVPEGWAYRVLYLEPRLVAEWAESDAPPPRAARWVVFRDRLLRDALIEAHRALRDEPAGLSVDGAVLEAVDALTPHLRAAPRAARRRESAAVARARTHLEEQWDQRVSLAELSALSGLSRFELVRQFRGQTGLPPHAFQVGLRVQRARGLLAGGEAPAAVAGACGFADQAHLTRTFRRTVGTTPARFAAAVG